MKKAVKRYSIMTNGVVRKLGSPCRLSMMADQNTGDKNHVEQFPGRGVRFEDDDVQLSFQFFVM